MQTILSYGMGVESTAKRRAPIINRRASFSKADISSPKNYGQPEHAAVGHWVPVPPSLDMGRTSPSIWYLS